MSIKKQAWNSYAQQDRLKALVDLSSKLIENRFNRPFNFGQYTFDLTNLNGKKQRVWFQCYRSQNNDPLNWL